MGEFTRERGDGAPLTTRSLIARSSEMIYPQLWTAGPGSQISPHRQYRGEDSGEEVNRWSRLGPYCREPRAKDANWLGNLAPVPLLKECNDDDTEKTRCRGAGPALGCSGAGEGTERLQGR